MRFLAPSLLLLGCAEGSLEAGVDLPDFALEDVNPTATTYGTSVAVSDFAGQASAWYFTHAT